MQHTIVKTLMTPNPVIVSPQSTLKEAAQKMKDIDCGVLPVGHDNQFEGMITDRDIVIRAVARGKDITTEKVKDYMTNDVYCCTEGDTVEEAANLMRDYGVTRLIVKNGDRISGIITFGSILRKDTDAEEVSDVVEQAVGRKQAA